MWFRCGDCRQGAGQPMTNQMMAVQWYPDRLPTPGVDWPLPSAARPTPPVKRYVVCNDMVCISANGTLTVNPIVLHSFSIRIHTVHTVHTVYILYVRILNIVLVWLSVIFIRAVTHLRSFVVLSCVRRSILFVPNF